MFQRILLYDANKSHGIIKSKKLLDGSYHKFFKDPVIAFEESENGTKLITYELFGPCMPKQMDLSLTATSRRVMFLLFLPSLIIHVISIVFLVLSLTLYYMIQKLRSHLFGKCFVALLITTLLNYLNSLGCAIYVLFWADSDKSIVSDVIYYSLFYTNHGLELSAYFWLVVISMDLYSKIRYVKIVSNLLLFSYCNINFLLFHSLRQFFTKFS